MIIKHLRLIIKQHGTIKVIDTLETYHFPTVIYDVFMHNNAFWSNSNAFSLIICKVYTKGENSGSWKYGPKKLRQATYSAQLQTS